MAFDNLTRRGILKSALAVLLCFGCACAPADQDPEEPEEPQNTETTEPDTRTPAEISEAAMDNFVRKLESGNYTVDAEGFLKTIVTSPELVRFLYDEDIYTDLALITLNGATYRLLVSPSAISSSLLGEELGSVTEFNIEPALGSGGVVSNVVSRGEKVYAVSGMNGALAAANVEGSLRVFQRVSYAGTAVIGRETLEDTLCSAEDVKWIEVSSLGRVSDSAKAQQLMETLLEYADYTGTAMSGSGSMQIGLKNGLTLQLLTGEDSVSACGSWSCPDFFEEFAEAVQ